MTFTYSDILVTLVIIGVVLFAAHRLGQVNPMGTGKLAKRLSAVEFKVGAMEVQVTQLDETVQTIAASTKDTTLQLAALRVEMAGDRGLSQRTWDAIDRLQNYFIEDAFKRRGQP